MTDAGTRRKRSQAPVESDIEEEDSPGPSGQEEDGQHKRPRQEGPMPFLRGTIKRVRVHDFMTYCSTVTIEPGPRLNLVLGPNGTGKSSFVCALCVGLGGSTKNLGRADNLGDYVRRGQQHAWTEVTLSGGPGERDKVVRRDIKLKHMEVGKSSYASTWKINGRDAKAEEVAALVKKENIQFDNLCQFLPQDKVVEFSGLNPVQMLEATQLAIGDASLHRTHCELIDLTARQSEFVMHHNHRSKELARLQQQQQQQQRDYDRFEAKERLQMEVDLIQKKRVWLEVGVAQRQLQEADKALKAATAELTRRRQEAEGDERPTRDAEARVARLEKQKQKAARECSSSHEGHAAATGAVERLRADLDDVLARREGLQEESRQHQAQLAQKEAARLKAKQDFDALPAQIPTPEMQAEGRALQDRYRAAAGALQDAEQAQLAATNAVSRLTLDMDGARQELRRLEDVQTQRLRLMDARRRGVADLRAWVHANQHGFRGPVYGPIGVEVEVLHPDWAPIVEACIFPQIYNWVVTYREDEEILLREVKARRLQVSINVARDRSDRGHPGGEAGRYQNVLQTVDGTIVAPEDVMNVLKDQCKIHCAYICREAHHKEVIAALQAASRAALEVFTDDFKRRKLKTSMYNALGASVTLRDYFRNPSFMGVGAGQDFEQHKAHLQQRVAQVEQALAEAQQAKQAAEQQYSEAVDAANKAQEALVAHKRGIQRMEKRKNDAASMLRLQTEMLQAEKAKPDPLQRGAQLTARLHSILGQMQQQGLAAVRCLHTAWARHQALAGLELALCEAAMQVKALKAANEGRRAALREAEREEARARQEADKRRRRLDQVKAEAQAVVELTDALREAMRELPDDDAELDGLMRSKQAEADGIVCNNANVVAEFQARSLRIAALQKEVDEKEAELAELQARIEENKARWLPELQHIVGTINSSFSSNFGRIGMAGEVVLREDDDFAKYAIEIRVKFRADEDFMVLDRNRQSGGERSVSTMLYLIALQGVAKTPFRVVDEINQGMDPHNERKVFEHLVKSSCKEGTPQCFLMTPKLLPDLPFTHDITVLTILNGPLIAEGLPMAFNKAEGLYGKRYAAIAAH